MSQDFLKKISDPLWRLSHLYKITDKQSNLFTFKPNHVQRIIEGSDARRKITLKARQFGITTEAVLRRFDSCIWNKNRTVCILAHKQDVLEKIFNIVKTAYKHLPDPLKPKLDRGSGSKYEYRFPELNSTIYTALEVRGGTVHELHISEAAFIPDSRIRATLQAVPLDGIAEFESTANGLNHFYDLWGETDDGYTRFFFPWFMHADYQIRTEPLTLTDDEQRLIAYSLTKYGIALSHEQIAFRRYKIKEFRNNFQHFIQEYPEDDQSCFLSSGNNPMNTALLKEKLQSATTSFKVENEIRIYKPFDKTKSYVIGADVAEGVRKDYSVATCICVEDKEEVAFFRGHIKPEDFAEVLNTMGRKYSRAGLWPFLIVERNNHGHAVILKLKETLCYPNLWVAPDGRIGHYTTTVTRPLLLDAFIEVMDDGMFKFHSKEIFSECLTLVDNKGKIEAEDGKHDDAVISPALAVKVVLERLPKLNFYKDIKTKILV